MKKIGKRVSAYLVNYMILFIPVLIVSIFIYEFEASSGILDFYDHSSGLWLFEVLLVVISFPLTLLSFIECISIHRLLIQLTLVIPVFTSFITFDTLTALIFRNDIGSLPFGLIIVDKYGNRASRWRIVLRTFLKYLTVFLCPILLLLPLFNRRNACLHELISGAYKVEKPKPVYPPMYYPPQQQ